jgi:hypothetical protein
LLLLPLLVAGLLGTTKAWAYSTGQINALLENGTSTAVGWDRNYCRKNLYDNIAKSGVNTLRSSINGDGSYLTASYVDKSWLSGRGVPNTTSPTYVNWGQTSIPLQINSVTFLCRPLVSPETYSTTTVLPKSPYSLNLYNQTGYWVMSSANANDRAPNRIGTTNMRPARVDTLTKITRFTVSGRAGATMTGAGAQVYISRNGSSRYWFPRGPVNVVYDDPAGITQPTTIKITMYYKVVQGYHALSGPARVEACTGMPLANNIDINRCDEKSTTLTITFAPNATLSAKTVSNRATVYPGQTIRFTHTITKTGVGSATYYKRLCGAYSAAVNYYPGNCGARSVASNNYSQIHDFTVPINTTNIGAYYCERITYSVTASSADAGTSKAACVKVLPIAPSCGDFAVTPEGPDPYTRFSITPTVSSPSGTPYLPATMTLSLVPFAGNTFSYGPVTQAVTSTSYPAGATFGPIGPTNQTGRWQVNWSYTDKYGTTINCGYSIDSSSILPVANKPYVAVYGGDVAVGQSPMTDNTCYQDDDGGAYGWSNYTSDFKGAGAQYAVMALGQVHEFASNLDNPTASVTRTLFANTGLAYKDIPNGVYGGTYGATNTPCDVLSDVTAPLTPASSTVIPTGGIGNGTTITQYVDGDIYIGSNVYYTNSSWGSTADIPSYKLIVQGDIYIGPGVHQLDGIYAALATYDDATGAYTGGNIYTCASSLGNPVDPASAGFYTTCRQQLVVNGAFVAKQVHLLRTAGSLGQSTGDNPITGASSAAELFNYPPELWLPRGSNSEGVNYRSITGLPPVL